MQNEVIEGSETTALKKPIIGECSYFSVEAIASEAVAGGFLSKIY